MLSAYEDPETAAEMLREELIGMCADCGDPAAGEYCPTCDGDHEELKRIQGQDQ